MLKKVLFTVVLLHDEHTNRTDQLSDKNKLILKTLYRNSKPAKCTGKCNNQILSFAHNFRKKILTASKTKQQQNYHKHTQNTTAQSHYTTPRPQFVSNSKKTTRLRNKRAVPGFALTAMAGVVMDGIGMIVNWRKDKKLMKAISILEQSQNRLMGKVERIDQDLMSLAFTVNEQISTLWSKIKDNNDRIVVMSRVVSEIQSEISDVETSLNEHEKAIRIISWTFGTLQADLLRTMDLLEILDSRVEILFNAIDNLSTGTLSHHVISATQLTCYLQHIEDEIEKDYPKYELALKEINKYYDMKLISFVAYNFTLYVHIPVYLKLRVQPILDIYRVESVPIPFDPADIEPDENGEWVGDYTQLIFEKKYLAMSTELFISLDQNELDNCNRFGGMFYCENPLLLTHINDHNCASAIFHDRSDLIKTVCAINYLVQYRPKPTMMQDGDLIMFVGMPKPWVIHCSTTIDVPVHLDASPLTILKRQDICHCGFSAQSYHLHEAILDCEYFKNRLPSQLRLYYTINTAVADYFSDYIVEIGQSNSILPRSEIHLSKMIKTFDNIDNSLLSRQTNRLNISSLILTNRQIDLTSPQWTELEIDPEITSIEQEQAMAKVDFEALLTNLKTGRRIVSDPISGRKSLVLKIFINFILAIIAMLFTCVIIFFIVRHILQIRKIRRDLLTDPSNIPLTTNDPEKSITGKYRPYRPVSKPKKLTTWIPLTLIMISLQINESYGYRQTVTDLSDPSNKFAIDTFWTYLDVLWALLVLSIFTTFGFSIYRLRSWIVSKHRNVLNQTKHCKNLFCTGWSDQCDVYVQLTTQDCTSSFKGYLGTILGPPFELKINGTIKIMNIHLYTGWFQDKLHISWDQTVIEYKGLPFFFPTDLYIRPYEIRKRLSIRHVFDNYLENRLCSLVIIYNNQLLVRNMETVRESKVQKDAKPIPTAPPRSDTLAKPHQTDPTTRQSIKDPSKVFEIECGNCSRSSFINKKDVKK